MRFPTDARPCRAADLTVSSSGLGAALGTTNIRVEFTDRSDTACVLLGHPRLAGVSPNGVITTLAATHGSIIGDAPWPAANIAPGQRAAVNVSGGDICTAARRGRQRIYPTLRITLPAGGHLDALSHGFDTICGVSVSRFGVPADAQPHRAPASSLIAHISALRSVRAGETVVYTVSLRNRGTTAYRLTPCPAYQEYLIRDGFYVHPNYYLNCDTTREIPVGGVVTYQMRLKLPADLGGHGPTKFGWQLHGETGPSAAEIVRS